jgi:hypothetical protein
MTAHLPLLTGAERVDLVREGPELFLAPLFLGDLRGQHRRCDGLVESTRAR